MSRFSLPVRAALPTLAFATLFAGACGTDPPLAPAFAFNRPEFVELVCLNPDGSSESSADADGGTQKPARPLVLPLRCCAAATPLNPDLEDSNTKGCGGAGSLHALVTQSTRGEVAAVDLVGRKVLDSVQRIPGYTFVDVGGLPRAIVTPSHLPGAPDLGPSWTYVASGEEQSIRAVGTCHFREGAECGPEGKLGAKDLIKVALPAAPSDMIFAKDALWVTLPDLSAIARIALPMDGDPLGAPFVVKDASDVQLFRVPVAQNITPAAPMPEMDEYLSACGLGYALDSEDLAAAQVTASFSEPVSGLGVASPTRLRFYEDDDLLLIADATQPVIHALSIDGEQLRVRGTLATGSPIRDFALTPAVPRLAGSPRTFADAADPAFGPDEVRYLYAIDDLGSVMVHSFDDSAGAVSSTPLRLPATRKRVDRLELGAAATAIEIVDNRQLTDEDADDDANGFVCDWALDEELSKEALKDESKAVDNANKAREAAQDAYDALPSTASAAEEKRLKEALDDAKAAYTKALEKYELSTGKRSILDNVGPNQLRGVFAFITTVDGFLNVIDIHDLDLFCRGERACETDSKVLTDGDAAPVAVRRHTARVAGFSQEQDIDIGDPQVFAALGKCPEGTYPTERGVEGPDEPGEDVDAGTTDAGMADGGVSDAGEPDTDEPDNDETDDDEAGSPGAKDDVILCTTVDRWLARRPSFEAVWEGRIFTSLGGRLACVDRTKPEDVTTKPVDGKCTDSDLVLLAPEGFDLCARGVEGEGGGYKGDLVAFLGEPSRDAPADCAAPEEGQETTLHVKAAYRDRLELSGPARDIRKLSRCYPDIVAFQLRAAERFLVVPNGQSIIPHRLIADEQGRCVEDPKQDERLRARAESGVLFESIYASFELKKSAEDSDKPIVVTSGNNTVLARGLAPGGDESVPVSIRYFDLRGEVFVVDAAQGLRRFYTAPEFTPDTSVYR